MSAAHSHAAAPLSADRGPAALDLPTAADRRPVLAIVVGELTPYRVHFHRRVAREIPEMRLATVQLHSPRQSAWSVDDPLINTIRVMPDAPAGTRWSGPGFAGDVGV